MSGSGALNGSPRPKERLAKEVASLVASSLEAPAIVVGSLPPLGRDLDLLVRWEQSERLARVLPERGLVGAGSHYARFAYGSGYAIELIAAESFLSPGALDGLYASALPLEGLQPLHRPAPAHALLILARLVEAEGRLTDKRRARLQRILDADPMAWQGAKACASAWQAGDALQRLERAARGERTRRAPVHLRPRVAEVRRQAGRLRRRLQRRSLLVSFSGIDGSGKSLQSALLCEALRAVGAEAELIWNDLLGNSAMAFVGRPARTIVRALGGAQGRMADYSGTSSATTPGGQREVGRLAWATFVTVTNGLEQRVRAQRHLAQRRVVVFDRGPLDLAVRMQALYRHRAATVARAAAPRPALTFFLEIPPDRSLTRKDDVWSFEQLQDHARLYRALAPRFGAIRLDGERPAEELAAEIARTVWERLTG